MQFLPWDLDHSFGQFPLIGTPEQREKLSIHHPWRGDNKFLERMFKVEAFKKLYLQHMENFSQGIFQPERFIKQVDQIANAIRPAIVEESNSRLARFDSAVAGNPVEQGPMGPVNRPTATQPTTKPTTEPATKVATKVAGQNAEPPRSGPWGALNPIKLFAPLRTKSVIEQLAGKSQGLIIDNLPPTGPPPPGKNAFGPGFFLAPVVMKAFDSDKDQDITSAEAAAGFAKWFDSWDTDKSGFLTREQLGAGLNEDLSTTTPGPFQRSAGPRPPQ
jgi:hypothetical protein